MGAGDQIIFIFFVRKDLQFIATQREKDTKVFEIILERGMIFEEIVCRSFLFITFFEFFRAEVTVRGR